MGILHWWLLIVCFNVYLQKTSEKIIKFSDIAIVYKENEQRNSVHYKMCRITPQKILYYLHHFSSMHTMNTNLVLNAGICVSLQNKQLYIIILITAENFSFLVWWLQIWLFHIHSTSLRQTVVNFFLFICCLFESMV